MDIALFSQYNDAFSIFSAHYCNSFLNKKPLASRLNFSSTYLIVVIATATKKEEKHNFRYLMLDEVWKRFSNRKTCDKKPQQANQLDSSETMIAVRDPITNRSIVMPVTRYFEITNNANPEEAIRALEQRSPFRTALKGVLDHVDPIAREDKNDADTPLLGKRKEEVADLSKLIKKTVTIEEGLSIPSGKVFVNDLVIYDTCVDILKEHNKIPWARRSQAKINFITPLKKVMEKVEAGEIILHVSDVRDALIQALKDKNVATLRLQRETEEKLNGELAVAKEANQSLSTQLAAVRNGSELAAASQENSVLRKTAADFQRALEESRRRFAEEEQRRKEEKEEYDRKMAEAKAEFAQKLKDQEESHARLMEQGRQDFNKMFEDMKAQIAAIKADHTQQMAAAKKQADYRMEVQKIAHEKELKDQLAEQDVIVAERNAFRDKYEKQTSEIKKSGGFETLKLVSQCSSARNTQEEKAASGPPDYLRCPITLELIRDPVVASDGFTYERAAIEAFLARTEEPISPMAHTAFTSKDVRPNQSIKEAINDYVQTIIRQAVQLQQLPAEDVVPLAVAATATVTMTTTVATTAAATTTAGPTSPSFAAGRRRLSFHYHEPERRDNNEAVLPAPAASDGARVSPRSSVSGS